MMLLRRTGWILSILVIASATGSIATFAGGSAGPPPTTAIDREAPTSDWWAATRASIDASEYQMTWDATPGMLGSGAALQAPNRAQGLRTYFTPSGIRVEPRTAGADWTWGLSLAGYGFDGALVVPPSVEPVALGNRVEYRRGDLTEWYVNDERGLEQGFTFAAPPPATGDTGPLGDDLLVDLSVSGTLVPSMRSSEGIIGFHAAGGAEALRYADLVARDATGRVLPASWSLLSPDSGTVIRIAVDFRGAVFPVTIDPMTLGPDWVTESDQRAAWYSYDLGSAGDVNADGYDDVVVGAYRFDETDMPNVGKAYLFLGSATGPGTTPDWTDVGQWPGELFGHSVGTAGDVNGDGYDDVIVGAPSPTGGTGAGLAYVYYGSPSGLNATPAWSVADTQPQAWFARTVRTAGDVNGDGYDDVLIGAPHYDNPEQEEGKAWAYYGSPDGLSSTADWTTEGNQAFALYGRRLNTAGDVNGDGYDDIIVGAHYYDNDEQNEGRAFAFYGSPSGLGTTPDWFAEGNQTEAWFGRSVNPAGDVNGDGYDDVIVGAPHYTNDQSYEGRAFAFYGSPSGLSTTANWYAEADQADAWFGRSASGAGDVNGDGFDDAIVGAPNYDTQLEDSGKVFAYYGSPSGLNTSPDWNAKINQDHAWFGRWVGTAKDTNGDGYDDVLVGSPQYDNGQTNEGRAFLFFGGPGGL